jgi:hypothetical protein
MTPHVPEFNPTLCPPGDTEGDLRPLSPADELRRIETHQRRRPTTGIRTTMLRKNLARSVVDTSPAFALDKAGERLKAKVRQHEARRRRLRLQCLPPGQRGKSPTSAFDSRAGTSPSSSSSNWTCLTDQQWADQEEQVQITGKHLANAAEAFGWTPDLLDERDKYETSTFLANTRNRTAFIPNEEDEPWFPCFTPDPTSDLLFYEGHCEDLDTHEPAREFAARFASLLRVQKERRRLWSEHWSRVNSLQGTAQACVAHVPLASMETEGSDDATSSAAASRSPSLSLTVPGMPIHFEFGTTAKVPSITTHEFLDDSMNIVFLDQSQAWSVESA